MNICVCIKQVPDTTAITIDPVTNTLVRDGVPAIVNTFDTFALEAAARIRDKDPSTKIVAISMGPEQAMAALKECLTIAADKAYLISGKGFGGSDTLATSYILKSAIEKIEQTEGKFDAIFCGKQAIDGDTAQVGPEIAEHLGYPQVTCVLEASAEDGRMVALKEGQDGNQRIAVRTPCVLTFTKPSFDPRLGTLKRRMAANRAVIPVLSPDDLPNIDRDRIGIHGSPTNVMRSFVPVLRKGGLKIKEETDRDSAIRLFSVLTDAHVI